jgi:hypothetical protein
MPCQVLVAIASQNGTISTRNEIRKPGESNGIGRFTILEYASAKQNHAVG